jgi:HSP20 family protein
VRKDANQQHISSLSTEKYSLVFLYWLFYNKSMSLLPFGSWTWNPFDTFFDEDRPVGGRTLGLESNERGWPHAYPRCDVGEVEPNGDIIIRAEIPGVTKQDLKVEVHPDQNQLTISGEVKSQREATKGHTQLRERRYGQFKRTFSLPPHVNLEKIRAQHENGLLTLHVPKHTEKKPEAKQIPITWS